MASAVSSVTVVTTTSFLDHIPWSSPDAASSLGLVDLLCSAGVFTPFGLVSLARQQLPMQGSLPWKLVGKPTYALLVNRVRLLQPFSLFQ